MSQRTAQHEAPRVSSGFFEWIRGAALVRSQGWIGGVANALSARVGIDPILMRGIFVVLTLIGFPAILLYAILWLVLPDEDDVIQLQELRHGKVHPPQLGILVTFAISFAPTAPVLWFAWRFILGSPGGYSFYDVFYGGSGVIAMIAAGLVGIVTVAVAFILLVLMRRANADDAILNAQASLAVKDQHQTLVTDRPAASAAPASAAAESAPASPDDVTTQVVPDNEADAAFQEWREQQAKTHADQENYRVELKDDAGAKARARAEQREIRAQFAQQAARRRAARRAANPRAGAAYTLGTIGTATVVGCIVALVRSHAGVLEALGLAALTFALITATGMIIAGLIRRRSGFLAFLTVGFLLLGVSSVAFARTTDVAWTDRVIAVGQIPVVYQPAGSITLDTRANVFLTGTQTNLVKGSGFTEVVVRRGTILSLNATFAKPNLSAGVMIEGQPTSNGERIDAMPVPLVSGANSYSVTVSSPGSSPTQRAFVLNIDQSEGTVYVRFEDADANSIHPITVVDHYAAKN